MWRNARVVGLLATLLALGCGLAWSGAAAQQGETRATTIVLTRDADPQPAAAMSASTGSPSAAPRTTPAPPCENGTIVPSPADNPELVADCAVLLAAKDTLRGTATLNWSAERPLNQWTGITVGTVDGVQRVTVLNLDRAGIDGTIPPALGGLTGLRELQLAWNNQLTGSIPAELGQLTRLTDLNLAGNRLTGPIPPELGAIGPQLTDLILSGPRPLPEGVGLTGSIPPQLGNLTGLADLYLDGNRLTGSIPTRLGRLVNLSWLYLARNQLSGSIPTQLGNLTNLDNLRLEHNRLTGSLPTQLTNLDELSRLYLKGNSGISGCVPPRLRSVRTNDLGHLNLPDCAADAPATPATPLPTYTLTVTAGEGGSVSPAGITTHDEAAEVTLTASWNDATHSFGGWGGDCSGAATTCLLELYANKTVTATFTALPADRCASPTDVDCIRAVYRGAPDDYVQVQDIPADVIIQPDADGRYQVERGQQITVVTAAQLPAGYTRFYLQQRPLEQPWPVSFSQLIPPVGTTYTFTPTTDDDGATLITFDLTAARPNPLGRPGLKPILGDVVVTTEFLLPVPPLTLALTSSRELCTANTLTELSWQIAGGQPPYTLTIDGQTVNTEADSHRANCGAIPTDPEAGEPVANPTKTFTATVTDSQTAATATSQQILVDLLPPLPAPQNVRYSSYVADVLLNWDPVPGAGMQSPRSINPDNANIEQVTGGVRARPHDSLVWTYHVVPHRHASQYQLPPVPGLRVFSVAAVRHPLELETPDALNWSLEQTYAATTEAQNVVITSTHDTVTVAWDKQPYARGQQISVKLAERYPFQNYFRAAQLQEVLGESGRHEVSFAALEPATDYKLAIFMVDTTAKTGPPVFDVRTKAAPASWSPPPTGAQNLQVTSSDVGHIVTWESPSPHGRRTWALDVVNVNSGDLVYSEFTHGATRWVIPLNRLLSSTRYRVTVVHHDLEVAERSIEFTTPAARASGQTGPRTSRTEVDQLTLAFFPIWPVGLDVSYAMTDDPFQWRYYTNQNRYHAGLDIGEHHAGAAPEDQVDGEPVYAVADGVMRVFADDLSNKSVMYCPEHRPLHWQLYVVDERPGSVWRDPHITDPLNPESADQIYCQSIVTPNGGRTALIAHTLPDGTWIVTKYGHLHHEGFPREIARALSTNFSKCDPALEDREPCALASNRWVRVAKGQRIASVGASSEGEEDGGFDAHVHFEIRHFNISEAEWNVTRDEWYLDARNCGERYLTTLDCTWSGSGPRTMTTVLDAEAYLPPLPASFVPRDVGCRGNSCTDPGPIADANTDEHVIEVASAALSETSNVKSLRVTLSMALWRPAFYTRYSGTVNPLAGQPSRTRVKGIASTGPGVDSYHTNMLCGIPPADLPADATLPIVPDRPDLPTIDVRADARVLGGDPLLAGELPREVRTLRLSLNPPCRSSKVTVRASNGHWEGRNRDRILNRADQRIELRDPSATLTWITELSPGAGVIRAGQSLDGHDFDFFSFLASRDQTYQFCAYPAGNSDCIVTGASSVATMELWGSAGQIAADSGTAELAWTPGPDDAAEQTVVLMVRRRDRVGDAGAADHPYTLTYSFPPPPPTDLSVTNRTASSITLTWTASPGASTYGVKHTIGSECDGEPTARTTGASYTFRRLEGDTQYTLCVQAQSGGAQSDSARSDAARSVGQAEVRSRWAPATARTLAPPPPGAPATPTGLRVTDVTDNGATLHWDDVTGATYKVRRDGDARTLETLGDVNEHPFTGLTPRRAHVLEVAASNSHGDSPFASLTLLVPPTLNTPTATANSITLTWSSVDRAASYDVKRLAAASACSGDGDANVTALTYPFTTGLTADTEYTLCVRARNAQGPSAWTSVIATTLAECMLTVTAGTGGTASGGGAGACGRSVTITATPNANYIFSHWSGGVSGSANPQTFTLSSDSSANAHFTRKQCTLTVTAGTGGSASGGGTGDCGRRVTITATPNANYIFSYWSGGTSGSQNPTTITVNSNLTVRANFTYDSPTCSLTVTAGTGGTASGGGTGLCGRSATITATPNANYIFSHWSGGTSGSANPQTFTLSSSLTAHANFTYIPPPPTCDPNTKPPTTDMEETTETGWDDDGPARRPIERTVTQKLKRNVTCGSDGEWDTGEWQDDGDPINGPWSPTGPWECTPPTAARPAEATLTVTVSTTSAWVVSGDTATKQRTVTKRDDTNPFSWSGPKACSWNDDWQKGTPYTETTTLETKVKPNDYVVSVPALSLPPITTTETRWVDVYVPPFFDCVSHEERRTKSSRFTTQVTYSWGGSSWVSSSDTTEMSTYSAWTRTGATGACSSGSQRSASSGTALLTAGDYELAWESQRLVFTVPAGATVELSGRTLDGGGHAAVLTVKGGAELVVTAEALSGTDEQRTARFAATTDPTLSAIAASLRAPAPAEAEPSVTTTTECAVAEASEDGVPIVNLDAEPCAIVRGGGAITVVQDGESLAITLAAGREWLILEGTGSDEAETPAAIFVDIASGGYITLALTDGAELARHIPEGSVELGAVFDAMLPAAPPAEGGG